MQSWYLLYCKRGQLQRAQEHLERQAVNCLAPMITLEKMVRGKRTAVSEPLFHRQEPKTANKNPKKEHKKRKTKNQRQNGYSTVVIFLC